MEAILRNAGRSRFNRLRNQNNSQSHNSENMATVNSNTNNQQQHQQGGDNMSLGGNTNNTGLGFDDGSLGSFPVGSVPSVISLNAQETSDVEAHWQASFQSYVDTNLRGVTPAPNTTNHDKAVAWADAAKHSYLQGIKKAQSSAKKAKKKNKVPGIFDTLYPDKIPTAKLHGVEEEDTFRTAAGVCRRWTPDEQKVVNKLREQNATKMSNCIKKQIQKNSCKSSCSSGTCSMGGGCGCH